MDTSPTSVVILTSFNDWRSRRLGAGRRHPSRSRRWVRARQGIWRDFTWRSLAAQDDGAFVHVVRYAPETREEVVRAFAGSGDHRVRLVARSVPDERRAIDEIVEGREQIVVVRLDSDDMLHPGVVGEVRARAAESDWEWGHWRHGYAASYDSGTVYRYDTRRVGPFFAHRYGSIDAFAGRGGLSEPRHVEVGRRSTVDLGRGRFVVGLTWMNTETSVASPSVGSALPAGEAAAIRSTFSLEPRSGWRRLLSASIGR